MEAAINHKVLYSIEHYLKTTLFIYNTVFIFYLLIYLFTFHLLIYFSFTYLLFIYLLIYF